jgi:predicted esterase
LLGENSQWQTETIQSAEPDGYGTYRWSYDMVSYQSVARALKRIQSEGYGQIVCGGFSAGCDMLLRTVLFTPARCDMLILQSPWIPIMQDDAVRVIDAVGKKEIALSIFCGSEDADCLPMAEQLYTLAAKNGLNVRFDIQKGIRHQFPDGPSALTDLLRGM